MIFAEKQLVYVVRVVGISWTNEFIRLTTS